MISLSFDIGSVKIILHCLGKFKWYEMYWDMCALVYTDCLPISVASNNRFTIPIHGICWPLIHQAFGATVSFTLVSGLAWLPSMGCQSSGKIQKKQGHHIMTLEGVCIVLITFSCVKCRRKSHNQAWCHQGTKVWSSTGQGHKSFGSIMQMAAKD